jgi:hypothetical protein
MPPPRATKTYSFSYSEWLLLPNLLQNSPNVIWAGACSLTLQCQCAPSPGPLGLEYVWTVFFSYALPFFQPLVASRTSRAAAMTCSSEGNSTLSIKQVMVLVDQPTVYRPSSRSSCAIVNLKPEDIGGNSKGNDGNHIAVRTSTGCSYGKPRASRTMWCSRL